MVGAAGIEPATPTMSTWCSPAELRALVPQVSDTKAILARIEYLSIPRFWREINLFRVYCHRTVPALCRSCARDASLAARGYGVCAHDTIIHNLLFPPNPTQKGTSSAFSSPTVPPTPEVNSFTWVKAASGSLVAALYDCRTREGPALCPPERAPGAATPSATDR